MPSKRIRVLTNVRIGYANNIYSEALYDAVDRALLSLPYSGGSFGEEGAWIELTQKSDPATWVKGLINRLARKKVLAKGRIALIISAGPLALSPYEEIDFSATLAKMIVACGKPESFGHTELRIHIPRRPPKWDRLVSELREIVLERGELGLVVDLPGSYETDVTCRHEKIAAALFHAVVSLLKKYKVVKTTELYLLFYTKPEPVILPKAKTRQKNKR